MRPRKILCGLIVVAMLVPTDVAALSSSGGIQAQDDRAERERKRNAERAAKQAAEQSKEYAETMKDVADELEELGASLLQDRYDDPFLQDYINEMGQSLVPKETPSGTLFSFRVLDNPEPNAFALPDGRVYVNSGLLMFVQNEAQLAVILGHEIAHVIERHYVESVRAQKREQLVTSVLGAAAGAVLGGLFGGKKGAVDGAAIGAVSGLVVAKLRMNNYNKRQEDEADALGATLALDRSYDAREGIALFTKLTNTYGDQGRFANALYGKHSRNKDRIAYIDQLLSGNLGARYNELRSAGNLTTGTGQMHLFASRMIREVAIKLMDSYDQYAIAKEHLERIADFRASDPRTQWALGRAYKRVGRTDQDRAKALDFFQRAVQLDQRNLYPYLHFDLGLMHARLGATAAAVESLKKYVVGYVDRYHVHPDDLSTTYDYLLTFGDGNWTAPAVDPTIVRALYPTGVAPVPATKTDDEAGLAKGIMKPPTSKPTTKPEIKKPEIRKPSFKPGGDRE